MVSVRKQLEQKLDAANKASNKENLFEILKNETVQNMLQILNEGDGKSIKTLKMIGTKRVEDIMAARNKIGAFSSLDDLRHAGLSQKQIETIFKANIEI